MRTIGGCFSLSRKPISMLATPAYIIAGEFRRGRHRGGGRYVNVFQRDRIRALQLMTQAMARAEGEQSTRALSDFCLEFANMFKRTQAWRFQYRSDLSTLPDYGEEYRYYGRKSWSTCSSRWEPGFLCGTEKL